MIGPLSEFANNVGLLLLGVAIGAVWVAAIASPNCSFDKLDGSRADRHVRELLYQTATPIGFLALSAAIAFVLGGSWIAAACAAVSGFGFFSTRLMLAPKEGRGPPGTRTRRKEQRGTSVSLSLMFEVFAVLGAILGAFGV